MVMKGDTGVEFSAISSSLRGCLMPAMLAPHRNWLKSEMGADVKLNYGTGGTYGNHRVAHSPRSLSGCKGVFMRKTSAPPIRDMSVK